MKQDTETKQCQKQKYFNKLETVEIRNKTNERKQCQKQNIFQNKNTINSLERSDQKANNNSSAEMKISQNVK